MHYYICGLGAIGSNLLTQLIKIDSTGSFTGIDFDRVEERNLNTQAYFLPHVGMFKAQAMGVVLAVKKAKVNYRSMVQKVTEDTMTTFYRIDKNDFSVLFIDCFDNSKSRQLLEGFDNCLHIGFSPQYTAEIIWGNRYTAPKDIPDGEIDICEMGYAVPFINFVVSVASMVIKEFLDHGNQRSYLISNKIKIREI